MRVADLAVGLSANGVAVWGFSPKALGTGLLTSSIRRLDTAKCATVQAIWDWCLLNLNPAHPRGHGRPLTGDPTMPPLIETLIGLTAGLLGVVVIAGCIWTLWHEHNLNTRK